MKWLKGFIILLIISSMSVAGHLTGTHIFKKCWPTKEPIPVTRTIFIEGIENKQIVIEEAPTKDHPDRLKVHCNILNDQIHMTAYIDGVSVEQAAAEIEKYFQAQ